MAFTTNSKITSGVACITLEGELDAAAAPLIRAQVEAAVLAQARRLVLLMSGLSYMASAGLRVLAFARQKMGPEVDIYMIGVNEPIRETLRMTGFHNSVILLDAYDPQLLEAL